jgi:AbrB family looped-hinge helix DNA binding protein
MATTKTTRMDAQGRVLLPPHIRKELNLRAGQQVDVSMENGTIKIKPAEELCAFCGDSVKEKHHISLGNNHICRSCGLVISKILNKEVDE